MCGPRGEKIPQPNSSCGAMSEKTVFGRFLFGMASRQVCVLVSESVHKIKQNAQQY